MKLASLFAFLFLALAPAAHASRLDIAVLQFSEIVDRERLDSALASESLFDATNADRVRAADSMLRGASVLFAQTLTPPSGGTLDNSTRIGNQRAEVTGRISAERLSLQISLSEGVDATLRRFSRRVYEGDGSLQSGSPRTLSLRQIETKSPSVRQGKTKMVKREWTIAIVYQFTR